MDKQTARSIEDSIRRVEEIVATNIFGSANSAHPLVRSAFIEVCIQLSDLLAKCENLSSRVDFTDDVNLIPQMVDDVTALIAQGRNAGRHIQSKLHVVDVPNNGVGTWNVIYGKGSGFMLNGFAQSGEYEDDVAFWFGVHRIYLRRHIFRAFGEVKARLLPLIRGSATPTPDEILGKRR